MVSYKAAQIALPLFDLWMGKANIHKVEGMMQRLSRRINRFTDQQKRELLLLMVNRILIDYDKDRGHTFEMEIGIPIVDNIKKASKPYPKMPAIEIASNIA